MVYRATGSPACTLAAWGSVQWSQEHQHPHACLWGKELTCLQWGIKRGKEQRGGKKIPLRGVLSPIQLLWAELGVTLKLQQQEPQHPVATHCLHRAPPWTHLPQTASRGYRAPLCPLPFPIRPEHTHLSGLCRSSRHPSNSYPKWRAAGIGAEGRDISSGGDR